MDSGVWSFNHPLPGPSVPGGKEGVTGETNTLPDFSRFHHILALPPAHSFIQSFIHLIYRTGKEMVNGNLEGAATDR